MRKVFIGLTMAFGAAAVFAGGAASLGVDGNITGTVFREDHTLGTIADPQALIAAIEK